MALFTHLTFYLIFQALLIDGSNLTTSKQLTFLQNCTRDRPSIFPSFVMTSYHLLGCDMPFATCCLYHLSPAFVHKAIASWHTEYSFTCHLRSPSPLSTSSREQRSAFHCFVPRTTGWQGSPCRTGGWSDWRRTPTVMCPEEKQYAHKLAILGGARGERQRNLPP